MNYDYEIINHNLTCHHFSGCSVPLLILRYRSRKQLSAELSPSLCQSSLIQKRQLIH